MVWKRVLLVELAIVLAVPTIGVLADEPAEPQALDFWAEVYPYGTKSGGVFLSSGMHGAGLVYHMTFQDSGSSFSLCAEHPVNGLYPDFDMVAVDANDFPIGAPWNDLGCESGTIPLAARGVYIYMPSGPDPQKDPLKGTFRFIQP